MRKKSNGRGLLIVVELGSDWPAWVDSREASSRRVVAQDEGESPAAFAERVGAALDGLFGKGIALTTVALSCNERIDEAADRARRKLAGLALGTMAKNKAGKVYLTASPLSSGRLRHSLSALSQSLFDEWRTAGLQVSVELGEEARSAPTAARFALSALTARVA